MAFYQRFGDCPSCEALYPGPAEAPSGPAALPGPTSSTVSTTTALDVHVQQDGSVVCTSRWWLWLAVGFGIGYLVND